jgi:hypothetical protein
MWYYNSDVYILHTSIVLWQTANNAHAVWCFDIHAIWSPFEHGAVTDIENLGID